MHRAQIRSSDNIDNTHAYVSNAQADRGACMSANLPLFHSLKPCSLLFQNLKPRLQWNGNILILLDLFFTLLYFTLLSSNFALLNLWHTIEVNDNITCAIKQKGFNATRIKTRRIYWMQRCNLFKNSWRVDQLMRKAVRQCSNTCTSDITKMVKNTRKAFSVDGKSK